MTTALKAITALDGRYAKQVADLSPYFSEWALIKYRVLVETEWLLTLSAEPSIPEVRAFTPAETAQLAAIATDFDEADAARVKEIERTTNHDVKAVEYFVKQKLDDSTLRDVREWVHFACTSEDINNLAYGLMCHDGMEYVWIPLAEQLVERVAALAEEHAAQPMLARTHGQTASPTTVGKEMAVFAARWRRSLRQIRAQVRM